MIMTVGDGDAEVIANKKRNASARTELKSFNGDHDRSFALMVAFLFVWEMRFNFLYVIIDCNANQTFPVTDKKKFRNSEFHH